jgi:hypothetical protein
VDTDQSSAGNYRGAATTLDLLGIAFVVLKLCGVIDWSWWLVLLPLYGPLALAGVLLAAVGVVWVLDRIARSRDGKRSNSPTKG